MNLPCSFYLLFSHLCHFIFRTFNSVPKFPIMDNCPVVTSISRCCSPASSFLLLPLSLPWEGPTGPGFDFWKQAFQGYSTISFIEITLLLWTFYSCFLYNFNGWRSASLPLEHATLIFAVLPLDFFTFETSTSGSVQRFSWTMTHQRWLLPLSQHGGLGILVSNDLLRLCQKLLFMSQKRRNFRPIHSLLCSNFPWGQLLVSLVLWLRQLWEKVPFLHVLAVMLSVLKVVPLYLFLAGGSARNRLASLLHLDMIHCAYAGQDNYPFFQLLFSNCKTLLKQMVTNWGQNYQTNAFSQRRCTPTNQNPNTTDINRNRVNDVKRQS